MALTTREIVLGVKWIKYEGCNGYSGHGAINMEGTCPAEWDAAALGRQPLSANEVQVLMNIDVSCQGFTYDTERKIYWRLTDVNPAGFRKKHKGYVVYLKEDAAKHNASRRRKEHVMKQMSNLTDRYTGSETWIKHENANAYTGHGATNMEGLIAIEWDAAARSRPPTTLAEAKLQCDKDPDCHGFTYDPMNLMYWKLTDIVDPRKFRRAFGHEYHVYVKEKVHLAYTARIDLEYRMHKAMFPAGSGWSKGDPGKGKGEAGVAFPFGWDAWLGKDGFKGAWGPWFGQDGGKGGWDGGGPWAVDGGGPMVGGFPPAGTPAGDGLAAPGMASMGQTPPSFADASVEPPATQIDVGFAETLTPGMYSVVVEAPTGKGEGSNDGKGESKGKTSNASKFDNAGKLESAPSIIEPKTDVEDKPTDESTNKPKSTFTSFRRRANNRKKAELTPCTITLHGPGFQTGREDLVLDACQELAFIEGMSWPDYAIVVDNNLCYVEWPSPEDAKLFCRATGGTLMIEDRNYWVKPPRKFEEAPTSTEGLTEGMRVEIQKLTGAKELNGKFAVVGSFNETTGRYIVTLEEDADVQKSLKPENLRSLGPALAAAHPKAAAKPRVLKGLPEGSRVLLEKLSGRDLYEIGAVDLNGQIALVHSFDKETGQYSVELEDQKGMIYRKLKPEHLRPLEKDSKEGMTELEMRKRKALGGYGKNSHDVAEALEGVNGDMWANFLNMFGNEHDHKRKKAEE